MSNKVVLDIIRYWRILICPQMNNDRGGVAQTSEGETSMMLPFEVDENSNLHPNELSGDENGQQSVFASSLQTTKANFLLTTTTIVKTVIGSGILALPYTMDQMGFIFGSALFIIAGLMVYFGSFLLLKVKNLSHHSNFSTIFYEVWRSPWAKGLGSLIIFLTTFGVCIAELIIFKASIRKILGDVIQNQDVMDSFYTQTYILALLMALLEVPFTMVKKIEKLRMNAFMGVSGIVFFMVSFVIFFIVASIDDDPNNNPVGGMKMFPEKWLAAAAAVPNILLSMGFQLNFFPIFKGMKDVSDSRMANATAAAIGFCSFSYILVGIIGYQYVGPGASANFLESLSYEKIHPKVFFYLLNISFISSIFFAFPIMFFSCRNNFIAIYKLVTRQEEKKPKNVRDGNESDDISDYVVDEMWKERRKKARIRFFVSTAIIYVVIVGVAMGVNDIEVVFNVVGAICSSSVCILLPTFFYIRLVSLKHKKKQWKYYLSYGLLVVMTPYCLFSVAALYINIE